LERQQFLEIPAGKQEKNRTKIVQASFVVSLGGSAGLRGSKQTVKAQFETLGAGQTGEANAHATGNAQCNIG
jgi:hypothetical protein